MAITSFKRSLRIIKRRCSLLNKYQPYFVETSSNAVVGAILKWMTKTNPCCCFELGIDKRIACWIYALGRKCIEILFEFGLSSRCSHGATSLYHHHTYVSWSIARHTFFDNCNA
jgi:hypothetical protein